MRAGCHQQLEEIREHMSSWVCHFFQDHMYSACMWIKLALDVLCLVFKVCALRVKVEQKLLESIASIILFTKYTVKSRGNWTATFFIFLTFYFLSLCNILDLMSWKVMEEQDVNTQSKSKSRELSASIWPQGSDRRLSVNLDDAGIISRSVLIEAKNLSLLSATAEVFHKAVSVKDTNPVSPCSQWIATSYWIVLYIQIFSNKEKLYYCQMW